MKKTDSFCIDSYMYSSYIWEGELIDEAELLTNEQKAAYEDVLYETNKRFPHLSEDDAELYVLEYIQADEDEHLNMKDWKDELRALLEAVQTSINTDQTPDISVILGGDPRFN